HDDRPVSARCRTGSAPGPSTPATPAGSAPRRTDARRPPPARWSVGGVAARRRGFGCSSPAPRPGPEPAAGGQLLLEEEAGGADRAGGVAELGEVQRAAGLLEPGRETGADPGR